MIGSLGIFHLEVCDRRKDHTWVNDVACVPLDLYESCDVSASILLYVIFLQCKFCNVGRCSSSVWRTPCNLYVYRTALRQVLPSGNTGRMTDTPTFTVTPCTPWMCYLPIPSVHGFHLLLLILECPGRHKYLLKAFLCSLHSWSSLTL